MAAPAPAQTPFYQIYRRTQSVPSPTPSLVVPPLPLVLITHPTHNSRRLGGTLVEALDELINSGHINPQLALQTLNQVRPPRLAQLIEADPPSEQFDKSASNALTNDVKAKATAKGHLNTYRLCDEVRCFLPPSKR